MGVEYTRLSKKTESQYGAEYRSLKRANGQVAHDLAYAYTALASRERASPIKQQVQAKGKRK